MSNENMSRKTLGMIGNQGKPERTFTSSELALNQAAIVREAAAKLIKEKEIFESEHGQVDPETGCWEATKVQEQHCVTLEEAAEAILAIPTDQPALDRHDAVLTAQTIKVCNEQTLKELQSGICCIPGANELLAERVRQAVLAHTIEARRLYLGTSPENYLNWLEKRIEAGRAALEAGDKAGDPK